MPVTTILEQWNAMSSGDAAEAILPCCGSQAWAREMAARRPLRSDAVLRAAGNAAWWSLSERDWDEAFASHPRLGERHAPGEATARSLAWSDREQSLLDERETRTARSLAEGNRTYEAKFGRTFLVCASGKSAGEILTLLESRLENDPASELRETAEQQSQITALRLERWIEGE